MISDIRIHTSLLTHPKFRRFRRTIGPGALEHLVTFWCNVAQHAHDGRLSTWDEHDVSEAAGWDGDPHEFVSAMTGCGFLDTLRGGFSVHDWNEHQPWVFGAKERSEAARKAGKTSAEKRQQKQSVTQRNSTDGQRPVQRTVNDPFNGTSTQRTPSPYPSPSPNPEGLKEETSLRSVSCSELENQPPSRTIDETPVLVEIPLIPSHGTYGVTQAQTDAWGEVYPAVDVKAALLRAREWCLDNPSKRKTKTGARKFCTTWLAREQDRGGHGGAKPHSPPKTTAELYAEGKL